MRIRIEKRHIISIAGLLCLMPPAFGDTCSATNTNNNMSCSVTCPVGQSAKCSNGTGSTPPSCTCNGGFTDQMKMTIKLKNASASKVAVFAKAHVPPETVKKISDIKVPISVEAVDATPTGIRALFENLSLAAGKKSDPGLYCVACGPANECKVCPLGEQRHYCDQNGHPHVDCNSPW